MKTSRQNFVKGALALVGVSAGLETACGSSSSSSSGGTGGTGGMAANCSTEIHNNHGHEMTVTQDEVAAAQDMTYDITGAATHSHDVTLTSDDYSMLGNGDAVTVTSTEGGSPPHTHDVTVTC